MSERLMRAAVLAGPERIEVKQVPVPDVGPGMMEIEVKACGVCGSDVHMWKAGHGWGPMAQAKDFIMGHEFCGVVTHPGDGPFEVGERVTFWANLYCGECDMCRAGQEQLCRAVNGQNYIGFVYDGAYAERFVGPWRNAYPLPDTVSD
ncbi:MAG TPA: alcohol dehydrogenase catalytic domain-containing protein, partial [Candidatus Spyradenecus faecavium]|nr:alcohol dehydrogenase catalytic domain-containing protein [Candidatus Spyradenecus faecavium]